MSNAVKFKGPMCVVTAGYSQLLMPTADGLKLVALLQKAVFVEHEFSDHTRARFKPIRQPACSLEIVQEHQVVAPDPQQSPQPRSRAPLQLGRGGN